MKLLKELYKWNAKTHSKDEQAFKGFVKKLCIERGAKVKGDTYGNLYVIKGESETYPCVCAHLDEVHGPRGKRFKVIDVDGQIFGYDMNLGMPNGIGGDDKNGIWIGLKILEEFPAVKLAFFADEECGCDGSEKADMSFFDDCRFVVQCDRKGNSDLVNEISGVELFSDDFLRAVKPKKYGYETHYGGLTDALILKENGLKVSCCNMSCGYYNPHTANEYTIKKDIIKCLTFVRHIVRDCTDVYPHEAEPRKYSGFNSSYGWYGRSYAEWLNGYSRADGGKKTEEKTEEKTIVEKKDDVTLRLDAAVAVKEALDNDQDVVCDDGSEDMIEDETFDTVCMSIDGFPDIKEYVNDLFNEGRLIDEVQTEIEYAYGITVPDEELKAFSKCRVC